MAIGGKRPGAGRKSSWRSPTKMMRLPARYESAIIDYAKHLDSASESNEFESKSNELATLRSHVDAILLSLRPGDRASAKRLFNKLLARLEGQG